MTVKAKRSIAIILAFAMMFTAFIALTPAVSKAADSKDEIIRLDVQNNVPGYQVLEAYIEKTGGKADLVFVPKDLKYAMIAVGTIDSLVINPIATKIDNFITGVLPESLLKYWQLVKDRFPSITEYAEKVAKKLEYRIPLNKVPETGTIEIPIIAFSDALWTGNKSDADTSLFLGLLFTINMDEKTLSIDLQAKKDQPVAIKVTPKATLDQKDYTYTGKTIKIAPTVTVAGKEVDPSQYKIEYVTDGKSVGVQKAIVQLTGMLTGSATVSFNIVPKGTSLSKVTAASKGFTATWKKQTKETTGYELQYATNKKFSSGKKSVKITSSKTTKKEITKLKAKKTYYVRIRTYKTVSGKTYYSDWSATKKVTTKK